MQRITMGGTSVFVLAGTVGLGIFVHQAPKAQARNGCGVSTLRGEYLFDGRSEAPEYAHVPGRPIVFGGVRTFSGEGHVSQVETISFGGSVRRGEREAGVYTLDPDCTGTMTIADRNFDMFVSKGGREGVAIRTDEGSVNTQTFRRQAERDR